MTVASRLVSRGDYVRPGTYPLHSRFARAVNFSAPDHLISLVDGKIGPGPANIVVKDTDLAGAGETLQVTSSMVKTGEIALSCSHDELYSSILDLDFLGEGATRDIWALIADQILHIAPKKSAASVLNSPAPDTEWNDFDAAVAERIRSGAALLRNREWTEAARLLKGAGFGLTPTGDDILAGFLIGLNLLQVPRERIEELYSASVGENAISNSMLYFAKEGRVSGPVKLFLSSVHRGAVDEIPGALEGVMSHGATSGTDFAVGLVLAVQEAV